MLRRQVHGRTVSPEDSHDPVARDDLSNARAAPDQIPVLPQLQQARAARTFAQFHRLGRDAENRLGSNGSRFTQEDRLSFLQRRGGIDRNDRRGGRATGRSFLEQQGEAELDGVPQEQGREQEEKQEENDAGAANHPQPRMVAAAVDHREGTIPFASYDQRELHVPECYLKRSRRTVCPFAKERLRKTTRGEIVELRVAGESCTLAGGPAGLNLASNRAVAG